MAFRMLITADDSRESLHAATTAAALALTLRAKVRVVVVVEDDRVGHELARVADDTRERRRQGATNLLAYLRRSIVEIGVPEADVEVAQPTGEPFREILEQARTWPADMIVMAASDQRGVRSNYIGSVTQQVIEFASCPVLVVPGAASERGSRRVATMAPLP